jgi:zinc protease
MKSNYHALRALRLGLALVCLLFLEYSSAAAQQVPAKKLATVEGITEYQLDNGLRYLLVPDKASPTITINMTVLVGSRHEGYGETGMAHLLEHMLFKGSKQFLQPDKALEAHGAAKKYNGTTNQDRTNYYEIMPATNENLEFGIKFEADRLVNSFIKREDLAKEMTVVRNEFEMGENNPVMILRQRMLAVAFEWHNYGKSTIGNKADIERVPIENLQAFYKKYYQPDNVLLIVAGKFDEKKAHAYIAKYFGVLKKPDRELPSTYTEEPTQDGEREVNLRRTGKGAVVAVVYHTPAAAHPDNPVLDVLENSLTAAPSGRLYKALVETKKATGVGGYNASWYDPGTLMILAQVKDGVKPEEVRDILIRELEETLQKEPITQEEVDRSKKQILSGINQQLASTEDLALGLSEWAAAGDWRLLYINRDRTQKTTVKQVNEAAQKYLLKSNRTLGMYLPTAAKEIVRADIPATPDIAKLVKDYKGGKALAQGEEFDPTPENLEKRTQRTKLPVGLSVALLPKKTKGETVVAAMMLRFGNAESLQGQTSAVSLLGPMLKRGTKKYSRQQLQDELDKLEANLVVGSSTGQLSVSITAKRATLPAALDLLEEVLRQPTFPQKEFDLLKAANVQALKKNDTDPIKLASNKLSRTLNPYPKDHILYVPTIDESIERMEKVTLEQVIKLYQDQLGATSGQLAVVGDFDDKATLERVGRIVEGWKAKTPFQRIEQQAHTKIPGERFTIETPDKKNAVYLAGYQLALKESNPKSLAMKMANYILGGSGFTSLLTDRIRQKEGLSYTVGSQFGVSEFDEFASFSVFAICNPDVIEKVDKLAAEVLTQAAKDGVDEKHFTAAIKGWLEGQKVDRADDDKVAAMLVRDLYLGRTFAYYSEREAKMAKLTLNEVNDAMRELIQLKRLVIVRAGDFKKAAEK